MLKIQNLSVSYGSRRVLHDVSFDVRSGEVLALIGPNGAGKSTLIRAVSGVIPYTGHVRTNGDDLFAEHLSREREAVLDLRPEPHHVPAKRLTEGDRTVGEAGDFLQLQLLSVPDAGHDASALRAEVHCEINFLSHAELSSFVSILRRH